MPFGVDDALAVAGLGLTCLNGCVKGLAILSKATHFDRDVSSIRLQIELEQHKLFTWAEEAGLMQDPPILHMNPRDAAFVIKILSELDTLLSDDQLKKRFGFKLELSAETINALDDETSTLSKLGPRPQAGMRRANRSIFLKRTSPWRMIRWVVFDEKQVRKLLKEVKHYVATLQGFLQLAHQAKLRHDFDGVLRDAILHLDDHQKLDIIGGEYEQASSKAAIASVARLKQIRLKLKLSDSSLPNIPQDGLQGLSIANSDPKSRSRRPPTFTPSSSSLVSMRLSMGLLTMLRAARAQTLRTLTFYDKKVVLLEWKSGTSASEAAVETRVNQVAAFLQNLEPPFHSLPCRGYVKDYEANRYGYVFELPNAFQTYSQPESRSSRSPSLPVLPEMRSLRQLFNQSDITPSLNERLSIAVTLLETLQNLHTSGWLHKELRSDNIVFIRQAEVGNDGNIKDLSSSSMYVAGYVFMRADRPLEMTEPLKSEVEADLYRHPASLGQARRPFCKSFDIFSVGCTLLEIGLWTSFRKILEDNTSPNLSRDIEKHLQRRPLQSSSTFSSTYSGTTLVDRHLGAAKSYSVQKDDGGETSQDLLRLRYELLLSRLPLQRLKDPVSSLGEPHSPPQARCEILQSLAVAAGNAYTSVVEALLSVGLSDQLGVGSESEHEDALHLEINALAAVQTAANAT